MVGFERQGDVEIIYHSPHDSNSYDRVNAGLSTPVPCTISVSKCNREELEQALWLVASSTSAADSNNRQWITSGIDWKWNASDSFRLSFRRAYDCPYNSDFRFWRNRKCSFYSVLNVSLKEGLVMLKWQKDKYGFQIKSKQYIWPVQTEHIYYEFVRIHQISACTFCAQLQVLIERVLPGSRLRYLLHHHPPKNRQSLIEGKATIFSQKFRGNERKTMTNTMQLTLELCKHTQVRLPLRFELVRWLT